MAKLIYSDTNWTWILWSVCIVLSRRRRCRRLATCTSLQHRVQIAWEQTPEECQSGRNAFSSIQMSSSSHRAKKEKWWNECEVEYNLATLVVINLVHKMGFWPADWLPSEKYPPLPIRCKINSLTLKRVLNLFSLEVHSRPSNESPLLIGVHKI